MPGPGPSRVRGRRSVFPTSHHFGPLPCIVAREIIPSMRKSQLGRHGGGGRAWRSRVGARGSASWRLAWRSPVGARGSARRAAARRGAAGRAAAAPRAAGLGCRERGGDDPGQPHPSWQDLHGQMHMASPRGYSLWNGPNRRRYRPRVTDPAKNGRPTGHNGPWVKVLPRAVPMRTVPMRTVPMRTVPMRTAGSATASEAGAATPGRRVDPGYGSTGFERRCCPWRRRTNERCCTGCPLPAPGRSSSAACSDMGLARRIGWRSRSWVVWSACPGAVESGSASAPASD
jgi:hypothetical protein